jgi:C4-dicarboxylate-specific signal transduction histidine kinase
MQLEQLTRIYDKLQQLLKRHELLVKENDKLRKELKDATDKLDGNQKKIHALEQTVTVLKTVSGKMDDSDKKELEKRINAYLKEIDQCISMLSE